MIFHIFFNIDHIAHLAESVLFHFRTYYGWFFYATNQIFFDRFLVIFQKPSFYSNFSFLSSFYFSEANSSYDIRNFEIGFCWSIVHFDFFVFIQESRLGCLHGAIYVFRSCVKWGGRRNFHFLLFLVFSHHSDATTTWCQSEIWCTPACARVFVQARPEIFSRQLPDFSNIYLHLPEYRFPARSQFSAFASGYNIWKVRTSFFSENVFHRLPEESHFWSVFWLDLGNLKANSHFHIF